MCDSLVSLNQNPRIEYQTSIDQELEQRLTEKRARASNNLERLRAHREEMT